MKTSRKNRLWAVGFQGQTHHGNTLSEALDKAFAGHVSPCLFNDWRSIRLAAVKASTQDYIEICKCHMMEMAGGSA